MRLNSSSQDWNSVPGYAVLDGLSQAKSSHQLITIVLRYPIWPSLVQKLFVGEVMLVGGL